MATGVKRPYTRSGTVAVDDEAYQTDLAFYGRISMDRDNDGHQVDNQIELGRKFIASSGLDPDGLFSDKDIFQDNDISAFSGAWRPGFRRLLALVGQGVKSRIVIPHQDRLIRQPKELEELIELADQGKVTIISMAGSELNLGNSDHRLVARMLGGVGAKSSEDTARRVKVARERLREQGKPLGGIRAFGWRRPVTKEESEDLRHPYEGPIVVQAMADVLNGVSLNEIARRWRADKVPQPQTLNSFWTPDIIHRILANPRHAGLLAQVADKRGRKFMDGPKLTGRMMQGPALVDVITWRRVQSQLDARGKIHRKPRRRSLLTGLLFCSKCGEPLRRAGSRPKPGEAVGRKVWRCPSGEVSIDAAHTEETIVDATTRYLDSRNLLERVRQASTPSDKETALVAEKMELTALLADAKNRVGDRRLTLDEYQGFRETWTTQLENVDRQLAKLSYSSALSPYAGQPGALKRAWDNQLTEGQKRTIIAALWGKIQVFPARKRGLPFFDQDRIQMTPQVSAELGGRTPRLRRAVDAGRAGKHSDDHVD